MRHTRREFMRKTGLGLGALLIPTHFVPGARAALLGDDRVLVVLFLRGGADGINLLVPRGDEANYIALRQNDETGQDITLPPAPRELQLDGFFEGCVRKGGFQLLLCAPPGGALLVVGYVEEDLCVDGGAFVQASRIDLFCSVRPTVPVKAVLRIDGLRANSKRRHSVGEKGKVV